LAVLAEDLFQQARMERRTKTFTDTTLSKIGKQLATDLGLTPVITGFTDPIGTQVQLNESNLAFTRRILARFDGDLQIVGNSLHISPRSDVSRGTVTLEMNDNLLRVRAIADLAHQVNAITVTGWDAEQGKRINVQSNGTPLGPGSGSSGADILRNAVTERNHHIAHLAANNEDEAQALADALYARQARRFVCVEGTAEGNPALRVGTNVTLIGLSSRFDNTYYITRAVHRWDVEQGYETDFEAECAFWGGQS
jgi:phage protein D